VGWLCRYRIGIRQSVDVDIYPLTQSGVSFTGSGSATVSGNTMSGTLSMTGKKGSATATVTGKFTATRSSSSNMTRTDGFIEAVIGATAN